MENTQHKIRLLWSKTGGWAGELQKECERHQSPASHTGGLRVESVYPPQLDRWQRSLQEAGAQKERNAWLVRLLPSAPPAPRPANAPGSDNLDHSPDFFPRSTAATRHKGLSLWCSELAKQLPQLAFSFNWPTVLWRSIILTWRMKEIKLLVYLAHSSTQIGRWVEGGARASEILALGQDCYIYQNDKRHRLGGGGEAKSFSLSAKFRRCSGSVCG